MFVYLQKLFQDAKETTFYGVYRLLLLYALATYKIYHYKERVLTKYPVLRSFFEKVDYGWKYTVAKLQNRYIEPYSKEWVSTCLLIQKSPTQFVYKETSCISIYDDDKWEQLFDQSCDRLFVNVLQSTNLREGMIVLKNQDSLMYRCFFENKPSLTSDSMVGYFGLLSRKVDVKFLSVAYTHPQMSKEIYLDLDESVYRKNNTILSPLFVRRYLEYQNEAFVFDDNYLLKIMDNNIQTIELTSQQYIVLNNYDYTVETIWYLIYISKTI